MTKKAITLGRILLAIGMSLSALVVSETHQKMVAARSLSSVALSPNQATVGTGGTPEQPLAPFTNNSITGRLPAVTPPPDVAPTVSRSPSSTPGPTQDIALNIGGPGEQAQNLANLNANQIAVAEWSGASFPVEGFQAYTSPFGYRRSIDGYNYNEFHYGLDMAAPQGSYIRNWWSGVVVEVSDDSNCGTSVVVESGKWLHIYCHMEGHVEVSNGRRYMIDRAGGVQIYENQEVYAGQRLGRVGMTGRTTGPHLHWGLKYDENWVDPALVLRAMYGVQQTVSSRPARTSVQ